MKKSKIIALLIVTIFFLGNIKLAQGFEKEGKIHKNIYLDNIDLSNLTKKQASDKINKIINDNSELILNFSECNYNIDIKSLGVNYKIEESVKEAYDIGRNGNVIDNLITNINLELGNKKVIHLKWDYDENVLDENVDYISKKFYISPVDATIKLENGNFIRTKESYGKMVDKESLKEQIINKFENIYIKSLDVVEKSIEPKYKIQELSKIDTVLGTYETYFNPKITNRAQNIKIASNATTNIIVGSKDEFSFNSIISKSNIIESMKEAPVIVNGKLESGIGGGMCQVSSTIYNASLYAGMEITGIKNHTIPSSYISKGRDATVSLGSIDFKFKNNFETPILIYNEVFDNRIVSTIYGNKNDKREIEIITEIVETLPNKVVEKNSKDLYINEKVVEQEGRVGYKVNTFRIYKDNNSTKELIYKSFYPPMDKVIVNGIKDKKSNIKKTKPGLNKQPEKTINSKTEYV